MTMPFQGWFGVHRLGLNNHPAHYEDTKSNTKCWN